MNMNKKYSIVLAIILLALVAAGFAWQHKRSSARPPRPTVAVCGKTN